MFETILTYLLYAIYTIIFLLVCLFFLLYKSALYWKRKNVRCISPWVGVGNLLKNFVHPMNAVDVLQYTYNYFPEEKLLGTQQLNRPLLIIRDPDVIKQVCVKNFDSFMNHTVIITEDIDPLFGKSLVSLEGQRWREMRATLSPAFTGSKMRSMYVLIQECAERFCEHFRKEAGNETCIVEMKDIFTRYTNDVIATTAFGITCDSLKDKDNEFYKTGKVISDIAGFRVIIKSILFMLIPKVMKYFNITLWNRKVSQFFRNIIGSTMKYREANQVVRPDMIHLLMEARNGQLKHETCDDDNVGFATVEESRIGKEPDRPQLTDDDITAQAILFFLAGYETSSTLISFLSYELAVNVDIQKKLQTEIDHTFKKGNGVIDYESLLKMKYIDMVVCEALRKWPPAPATERICTQNCTILDGDQSVLIEKGVSVFMPVYCLQHDPKYFDEPEQFDPERFSDENKKLMVPFTYMPFGQGPRNCIGSRFALLEIKTLLAYLLRSFDIMVVEKTQIPLKLSTKPFVIKPEKGFWLGLKPRT